jgi:hypothetical protein
MNTRNITEVSQVIEGALPRQSYTIGAGSRPSGRALLLDPPNPVVDEPTAERLLTVLIARTKGRDAAWQALANPVTVQAFRNMNDLQRTALINNLWNAITSQHAFTTAHAAMDDPANDTPANVVAPLPSSWCPVAPGANTYHKRLAGKQPFRLYGIGFRVDGSNADSIRRNVGNGFTQQRLSPVFMLGTRGQRLDGTVLMDDTMARVWTLNHDIFNETAVCVSRNFFGATAFPERETNHKGSEVSYLWAVNCLNLQGFDTENYQVGLPGSRQWRPGEKAFRAIPADRVVGYVPVQRRGCTHGGGWNFDIAKDVNWTFTGAVTVAQRGYMIDELNAWRGIHKIPALYDFADPGLL